MAVWDSDYPVDIIEANTIHTAMKAVKSLLSERMKADNGTFDEHNVCQDGEDGLHVVSKIGFVKTHTSLAAFQAWLDANGKRVGTLHYVIGKGIYVISTGGATILTTITDHSLLADLTDPDCHSGLLLKDGSRAMQHEWRILEGFGCLSQGYGSDDDDVLDVSHVSLPWYNGHGAGSLKERHIPNGELHIYALKTVKLVGGSSVGCSDYAENAYGFPRFWSTGSFEKMIIGVSGGVPYIGVQDATLLHVYTFEGST